MFGNSKSVLFIDNSDSDFTGNDLNSTKVRGTESSLILLAESFVKKNINVKVLTEVKQDVFCNGVLYGNKHSSQEKYYDLCIAISNANLFRNISSKKKYDKVLLKERNVIEILDGDKNKSLMIGDSETDANAAKAAEIPIILLKYGYTEKRSEEIYHNHIIKDFVGIEKIISEYL